MHSKSAVTGSKIQCLICAIMCRKLGEVPAELCPCGIKCEAMHLALNFST